MTSALQSSILAPILQARFSALAISLGTTTPIAESWSAAMVRRYSEPQRHYHTLAHVRSLLACLDAQQSTIADNVAVELAVFFHDWIYDPQATDNEDKSVIEFQTFANEAGLDTKLIRKVTQLVEATVKHAIGEHVRAKEIGDLKLFLDFDLAVLGWEWEQYAEYAAQIRREYAIYEEKEYKTGRAKVLKAFLERERLYFSDQFYRESEDFARQNIKREIEMLDG